MILPQVTIAYYLLTQHIKRRSRGSTLWQRELGGGR